MAHTLECDAGRSFPTEAMSFEGTREDTPARNLEVKARARAFIKQTSRA